jgi:hypothetical protein
MQGRMEYAVSLNSGKDGTNKVIAGKNGKMGY